MMVLQCLICKHFWGIDACAAFPEGIPGAIRLGQFDHTEPYPNAENPKDNGIRFEPVEDDD